MEVTHEIYSWLKRKNIVSHNYKELNGKVKLTEDDTLKIELGYILPLLNVALPGKLLKDSELKKINSSASRLYNWNLLLQPLDELGITVNSDAKALIVAGDRMQILDVIESLYNILERKSSFKKIKASENGALLLNNIDENSSLQETESFLEFLILTFCKCFKLSPRVSAGLLVQKIEYLTKLIINGLKGDFIPILEWYDLILNSFAQILHLTESEQSSIQLLFTCLKPGIKSKNPEVKIKSVEIMQFFHNKYKTFENICWEWFFDQSDIIKDCFELILSQIENYLIFFQLLFDFSKKHLSEVFTIKLTEHCKNNALYINFISILLPDISQAPFAQYFYNQEIIDYWVELSLKESERDLRDNSNRIFFIGFLSDLWCRFPAYIEIQEELANTILGIIKRAARSSSKVLQIMTFGRLFHLLSVFCDLKYSFAPIIYKTLTFFLIEKYSDDNIREFLLNNMKLALNEFSLIPLGILLEPLIKQSLIGKNIKFNIFDFDFYNFISQHPRLTIKDAVLLLDLLGKIFLNDYLYSSLSKISFLIITARFIEFNPVQEFIMRFISISLKLSFTEMTRIDDFNNKIVRKNSLDLIDKIIKFNNEELNQQIREAFQSLISTSITKRIKSKKFQEIFTVLGGPLVEEEVIKPEQSHSVEGSVPKSLLWYSIPRGRAISDIQRIRDKRLDRENKERDNAEKRSLSNLLRKKTLRKQIENRRIELGVRSKLSEDESLTIIKSQELDPSFQIYRINEEIKEDQEMIQIVIKKYSRVNRFLFIKYASSSNKPNINPIITFDKIQDIKEYLYEPGFTKMVREHNISNSMIGTEEIKKIYKFLIAKLKVSSIQYENFPELMYLLSSLIFTRSPYDLSKYPPAIYLESLYESIKNSAENIPKHFFDVYDPGYGDRDVIKSLNAQLEKNIDIMLPMGYKKVLEPILTVEHKAFIGSESQAISLEILDSILMNSIGFHLLMPVVIKSSILRAKGILSLDEAKSISVKYINKPEASFSFSKLSPNMKVHALAISQFSQDISLECAQLVDDLIYSIEKQSASVISKVPKSTKMLTNKITEAKQNKVIEEIFIGQQQEKKRKNREKHIQAKVNKWKEQTEYQSHLENIQKQKELIDNKMKEEKAKEKREKEKFELNDLILKYKIEKLEKEKEKREMKRELSEGRTSLNNKPKHKGTVSMDFSRFKK